MFIKKFTIECSDVDSNFELKLSSLFRMMQEAATRGVEALGHGVLEISKEELMWVITRYQVDIDRMPTFFEQVVIKTYPGKDMMFMFPRYFQIENGKGDVLARASSTWCVLNQNTRKIVFHPFGDNSFVEEHIEGEIPLPIKVVPPSLVFNQKRTVRYSDVDLNGHLNNTRYVEYISDLHDLEFHKNNNIKSIVINYEREAKCGEEVSLYSSLDNGVEYVCGKIGETNIFTAKIEYK